MATNKIHFLGFLLFPYEYRAMPENLCGGTSRYDYFSAKSSAEVIVNDAMRCWSGPREFSHFTINPETGEVSWAVFPEADLKRWSKEMVQEMEKFSAGKPGVAVIDEATISDEFWLHNVDSEQNERFYIHLVQDSAYDRFVRSVIDTSHRYEDIYVFDGEELTGAQLRGQGMERWSSGILSELDDQFYVRLAKRYFLATGMKADRFWIDNFMKKAIHERYSPELAEATVKFVTLSDKAHAIIESGKFDEEVWPVPNRVVDQAIGWMMEDVLNALKWLFILI